MQAVVVSLATVAVADDRDPFLVAVQREYQDPATFHADLDRLRNLTPLLPVLEGVASVVGYLRTMALRVEDTLLGVERRECLLQANPAYVVQTPALWDGIAHRFQQL